MSEEGNNVDIEAKAKSIGWTPQDRWKGPAESWVDAKTFVERGETFVPFLKASNKQLTEKLSSLETKTQTLEAQLAASSEEISALKEYNSDIAKRQAKEGRKNLRTAIEAARKEGDVAAVVALEEQLDEHQAAIDEAGKQPVKEKVVPADQPVGDPVFNAWKAENADWFGVNRKKTSLAIGIAQEIRDDPERKGLTGRAFFEAVAEEAEREYQMLNGGSTRDRPDRVDGSRGSGGNGGGSGGGKSYASLPADAKAACDRFEKRLVGPGKTYKTTEDWRKKFVADYDWES